MSNKVLEEGHYRFSFKDNKELHQIFFQKKRCYQGCGSNNKSNIIEESWNTSRNVSVDGTEYNHRKLENSTGKPLQWVETQKIEKSDMDPGFLNCFNFHNNIST